MPRAALTGDPRPIPLPPDGWTARVRPPGSKSVTNRAFVTAALARGTSEIHGALASDDCDRLLAALRALGAGATSKGSGVVVIEGVDGRFPNGPGPTAVDLGDGGTPARFMMAAAALASHAVVVDGSARMRERPVVELIDLLRRLGVTVTALEEPDHLPVRIAGSGIAGAELEVPPTASSQFISALLLIAPHLPTALTLDLLPPVTSAGYIDATLRVLRAWNVAVEDEAMAGGGAARRRVRIRPQTVDACSFDVDIDASSATYWLTAGAIVPGASIVVEGAAACRAGQPDGAYADVLETFGVDIRSEGPDLRVLGPQRLTSPGTVDMSGMPDAAMSLAIVAACADGPTRLEGLHTLRVKESDRIAALTTELERVGCRARPAADAIDVEPRDGARVEPVVVQTYNDHRIALAFAILGLVRRGVSIADPECVGKSYPGFWDDLAASLCAGGYARR